MYSSSTIKKRSLIKRILKSENGSNRILNLSNRSSRSTYIKCGICLLIIYCLNFIFGYKSSYWFERSFENEYYSRMKHIDITKIEENVQDELGEPINILSNRFLIENQYLCGRSLDPQTLIQPHLLILIKSSPQNFKQRQAIRSTWGNKSLIQTKNTQLAFFLGTDPHNTSVIKESKKYGDIIQIDKIDYYYYSSYKLIMMLRWINDYCSSKNRRALHIDLRNYVLFVNDDYYIDLDLLLSYIYRIDEDVEMTTYERRIFITGELIQNSRPRRFVNDRWYVSVTDYPYDKYPSYISTECFLMTRYNARLFYISSKYVRLFSFEHIYIGLLAYSMSINFIENNKLFLTRSNFILNNQNIVSSRWKDIFNKNIYFNSTIKSICIHAHSYQQLIQIWNYFHQTNLTFLVN